MENKLTTKSKPSIFYIDFLRCTAAFAVVLIHVLGPFRHLYGEIPNSDWLAAAGINSMTRWAVPLFMMISGALLLSTKRPFECEHYLIKRLSKVAIPFIGWTIIYAFVGGFMVEDIFNSHWSMEKTIDIIQHSPNDPAWYHLWFFYDFIPLYFVIPFLLPLLKKLTPELTKLVLTVWALLFLMKWLKVESFLLENLILYTGYLIFGWFLFNRDNSKEVKMWIVAAMMMLVFNFLGTWVIAFETGKYSSIFMGYKTLNTVIIGVALFVVAQTYADKITGKFRAIISILSKYSLGIYLLHPLLLIPVRELSNGVYLFFGSNWIAIPVISIVTIFISLFLTVILAKIPFINKLVP
jgi:surface polysaccharide O-acyltransferase-like enzyme